MIDMEFSESEETYENNEIYISDEEYKQTFGDLIEKMKKNIKQEHIIKNTIMICQHLSMLTINKNDLTEFINYLNDNSGDIWISLGNSFHLFSKKKSWSKQTQYSILCRLKIMLKILLPEKIKEIDRALYVEKNKKNKNIEHLPLQIQKMKEDNTIFIFFKKLDSLLLMKTKQKSSQSRKYTLSFWYKLLNDNNIFKNDNFEEQINIMTKDDILKLCETTPINDDKRLNLINVLFYKLLNVIEEPIKFEAKNKINIDNSSDSESDVDGDVHRFTMKEIQKLSESCQNVFEKLYFHLLLTTALRVGGLSRIKIKKVAERIDNKWKIFDVGETIEKRNKVRKFPISHIVKPYLLEWLENERQYTSSSFLFPAKTIENKHMGTNIFQNSFKKLCMRSEITGKNAHIHSIRHTVGFMISELGNNIESVAKFLDHSSSKTTEKYYVKYSCEENLNRMNIPWIENENKKMVIPKCLSQNIEKKEENNKKSKKKEKLKDTIKLLSKMNQ